MTNSCQKMSALKPFFCDALCPNPEVQIYAKVSMFVHSHIVIILTFYVLIP